MKKARLGGFVCNGVPVFIEEAPVDTLLLKPSDTFKVSLGVRDELVDMGLDEILHMKQLMVTAERRIRLRQDQALKSRNMSLDL